MVLFKKIRDKNREIRRWIYNIEKLKSTVFEIENTTDELHDTIRRLLCERFATLDLLSSAYYELHGNKSERERIYNKTVSFIHDMQDSKSTLIKEMETLTNKHLSNLMVDFKNDFPKMLPEHRRIFMFTALNFLTQAICVFTDSDNRKLYNRRYAIKKQIQKSSSPRKEGYLDLFKFS